MLSFPTQRRPHQQDNRFDKHELDVLPVAFYFHDYVVVPAAGFRHHHAGQGGGLRNGSHLGHATKDTPVSPPSPSAQLNLVDLAGSERVSKSNAAGARLQEAKHINLSLHYLEAVIVSLQKVRRGRVGGGVFERAAQGWHRRIALLFFTLLFLAFPL